MITDATLRPQWLITRHAVSITLWAMQFAGDPFCRMEVRLIGFGPAFVLL